MWKYSSRPTFLVLLYTVMTVSVGVVSAEAEEYAAAPSEIGDVPPIIISDPGIPAFLPGENYGIPQPYYGPLEPQPITPYPYSKLPPLVGFNPGWGWNNPGWPQFPVKQFQIPNWGLNFPNNNGWGWPSPYLG